MIRIWVGLFSAVVILTAVFAAVAEAAPKLPG